MFLLSGFPGINKFKELKIVFGLGSRALLGCKLEPCWAREPKQKTFKVRTLAAIGPFKGCLATYVVYFLEKNKHAREKDIETDPQDEGVLTKHPYYPQKSHRKKIAK